MRHELIIMDGTNPTSDEVVGTVVSPPKPFRVVRELFKRGRVWLRGEVIDLDPGTGARLVRSGDCEEI